MQFTPYPKSLMGRVIFSYGIFSLLWFFCTNFLLRGLTQNPQVLLQLATLCGGVVAIVAIVLLYLLSQRAEQRRQKDLNLLQSVIEGFEDAIFVKDGRGRYVLANTAAAQLLDRSIPNLLGKDDSQLLSPEQAAAAQKTVAEIMADRKSVTQAEIFQLQGQVHTYLSTQYPWYGKTGQVLGVIGIARDITATEAKEQLRESEARFRSLIDSLPFCCWVYDAEGRYTFQNSVDIQQWGEVIGRTQDEVISAAGGSLDIWRDLRHRAMNGEIIRYEAEYDFEEGAQYFLTIAAPVRDDDRIYGVVGASIDITEQKRTEAQLRQYAFYDLLTRLPQRSVLLQRLGALIQAIQAGKSCKFALLHLDLPRFKIIKYSLGHQIAEALLIAMAERLKILLPTHALLTRASGIDEFSILLENLTDFEEATQFAEFLLQKIALPFHLEDHEIFVNVNIGIAFSSHYPPGDSTSQPEILFRAADIAMHQAQLSGEGNYAVFNPAIQVQAVQRLQMDRELRYAIAQEDFLLHYQPIINLTTRQLTGFEVLVRWQNAQRGVVSPGEFIPLAEETGMIIPLGLWVLKRACEQLQRWQKQFANSMHLTLSVNVSTVQLLQPDLLEQIDQILQTTQILPQQLKLEITETSIVQNAQHVLPVLQAIKDRQIHLSLDDFGTGYSSLTYLHTFPIDTLKIDRAFVIGMGRNSESLEIARTIILLAHTLKMDVVAEGIETVAQMEQLRALNCDYGQGYLFAHPLPANRIEHMLTGDRWIL